MRSFNIKSSGIYNSKIAQPDTSVSNARKTSMFELELPLEDGGVSHIDANRMPITTNLFICAKPGQVRQTQFPFRCCYVHISVFDEKLQQVLSAIPTFIEVKDRSLYKDLFDEIQNYSVTSGPADEIMQRSLILKLIYALYQENESNLNAKKYGFSINKAIDYIDQHLCSDLKLENIARQVAMSPIYFHNCFKSVMGKTLREYVEEQRIMESINLMLSTGMTLTEIAYACGFSSQSYFSYVFKRKMNTTPRKYIKSLNEHYEI